MYLKWAFSALLLILCSRSFPDAQITTRPDSVPIVTVSQIQRGLQQNPYLWVNKIVRVQGFFVQNCSLPDPMYHVSSCTLSRYPHEVAFGMVEALTQDHQRDLVRAIPLDITHITLLQPKQEPLLLQWLRHIPFLNRFLPPSVMQEEPSFDRKRLTLLVKIIRVTSCSTRDVSLSCYELEGQP